MNYISYEKLHKVNLVQIELLRAVDNACRRLGIVYFMVHGSLLGTVRNGKFICGDDDIDIAIPRDMYNRFLKEAPPLLNSEYFVQNTESDSEYPLEFAKVRDKRTTYVVDGTAHVKMNHGIYIDIFPIDRACNPGFRQKIERLKRKMITTRLSKFEFKDKKLLRRTAKIISFAMFPTRSIAKRSREKLYAERSNTEYIEITGGKLAEMYIPSTWFENAFEAVFEGIRVYIPKGYDSYLKCIYGDYENRTLIEGKAQLQGKIEINASLVSTEKPFTEFIK